MRKLLMNLIGISTLIKEQKNTNRLLAEIYNETKRNRELREAYNRAYHIE